MENAEKYWFKNLMRVLNLGIKQENKKGNKKDLALY